MASPYDKQFDSIRSQITDAANKYGIKPEIAIAQIWQESKFNPKVCSHAGACGIAQFMPGTAKRFGVNPKSIESSLEGYGKYMSILLKMFGGKYDLALAAYNAGEGNVKKYKGIPPFKETRNYVKIILGNAQTSVTDVISKVSNVVTENKTPISLILALCGVGLVFFVLKT